jgi:hypothetical protein
MAECPPTGRDPPADALAIPEPEAPAGGATQLAHDGAHLAGGARPRDHAARWSAPGAGRLPPMLTPAGTLLDSGGSRWASPPSRQPTGVRRGRRRAPAAAAATRPGGGASGPFRAALKVYRKLSPVSAAGRRPRAKALVRRPRRAVTRSPGNGLAMRQAGRD